MHAVKVTSIGIVALAVLAGACNNVGESPNVGAGQDVARNVDAKAELQRERDDDVSHLEKRVGAYRTASIPKPTRKSSAEKARPRPGCVKS